MAIRIWATCNSFVAISPRGGTGCVATRIRLPVVVSCPSPLGEGQGAWLQGYRLPAIVSRWKGCGYKEKDYLQWSHAVCMIPV